MAGLHKQKHLLQDWQPQGMGQLPPANSEAGHVVRLIAGPCCCKGEVSEAQGGANKLPPKLHITVFEELSAWKQK
ncbi:hypothetical protein P7K49_001658 [Saguinus oedipus]|uniref:Uncharacterized protein n=1 Tax=Saguinus oedipus TaxID=9490 RepID=A0ABQ9WF40_SAGOE|nr:hypothetical protein P7K49_001658 [Saguinus oedipus]